MPRKQVIKHHLSRAFGMLRGLRGAPGALPILLYHSVNAKYDPVINPITPELFEAHLRYLKAHHRVLPLRTVVEALENGRTLPANAVSITFDDGYADNYDVVFPLLKKYRIPATIFVVSGFVDGTDPLNESSGWKPLSWAQIREMMDSGLVEIGGHTHSHPVLSELDDFDAWNEVSRCKQVLESRLQSEVAYFAYPYGQGFQIHPASVAAAQALGFKAAFSTFWRSSHSPFRPFLINRVLTTNTDSVDTLRRKLRGDYDYIYYLRKWRAAMFRLRRGRGVV